METSHVSKDGVSFVVPVYNKAAYLPKTLRSIEQQRGDFDREFIFVDDGSSDDSIEVIRARTEGWPNVSVITQSNQGSASATNRGIAAASRGFIKFVDADDLLTRDATEALLHCLNESGALLAYGDLASFEFGDQFAPADLAPPFPKDVDPAPLKSVLRTSYFNPTQILVRTKAAQSVGGCDERVVHSQEYGLALRLARIGAFCHVHATLAWQLVGVPGRLSGDPARQLERVTRATAYFLRDFPDTPTALQRFAYRRAAGRAWKWARRTQGAGFASRRFRQYLRSYLPGARDYAAEIERAAQVFDESKVS